MYRSLRVVLALGVCALALPLFGATFADASSPPHCVVSLSPTATETLFAIGAGSQVQAVDTDSDYPKAGLPATRINALNPSVESILGICKKTASYPTTKPDLVVISYDANDIQQKLTNLGVKVVDQDAPTTLAGAYAQIVQLGTLTGHVSAAQRLVASLKRTVHADISSVPAHATKAVTVYYEIATDPYYSLTSGTFVGSMLKSLGVVNIADGDATSADAGYPELSGEYIASANPTLIFLAGDVSVASVAKRPGFKQISAVVNHHVVELDADIASRWGPRLGILMNQLTAAVKAVVADQSRSQG
ncbi:MAG: ABC transporter substrate-binding protein [Acidimicrobiales bacterium]